MNTSRAGLIAPCALLDALNNGHPGKVAIDVFETEPITTADDMFVMHLNLVATPHIGFVTEYEFEIQFSDIFDQLVTWQAGEPIHIVNPQVWPQNKL